MNKCINENTRQVQTDPVNERSRLLHE